MIIDKANEMYFIHQVLTKLEGMEGIESIVDLNKIRKSFKPLRMEYVKEYLRSATSLDNMKEKVTKLDGLEWCSSQGVSWLEYYGKEIKGSKKKRI